MSAIFLDEYNYSKIYNDVILNVNSDYFMFFNPNNSNNKNICETLFDVAIKNNSDIVVGCYSKINGSSDSEERMSKLSLNIFSIYFKLFKKSFVLFNNLKFVEGDFSKELFINDCLLNSNCLNYVNNSIFNVNLSSSDLNLSSDFKFGVKSSMKYIRGYDKNKYLSIIQNNSFKCTNNNQDSTFNKFKSYFKNSL